MDFLMSPLLQLMKLWIAHLSGRKIWISSYKTISVLVFVLGSERCCIPFPACYNCQLVACFDFLFSWYWRGSHI